MQTPLETYRGGLVRTSDGSIVREIEVGLLEIHSRWGELRDMVIVLSLKLFCFISETDI